MHSEQPCVVCHRAMPVPQLRRQIGVIPQENILFDESIGYNIQYGDVEAPKEAVVEAAKRARIHDSIITMPGGYETRVGERGCKLSGGERQRISIARAILRDPAILLCDEVTSAMDAFTEKEILDSLREVAENKTTLVIAHRLASIMDADQIIVMHKGRVVDSGTHRSLLAKPEGVYARMWALQREEDSQSVTVTPPSVEEHFNGKTPLEAWLESLGQCDDAPKVSDLAMNGTSKIDIVDVQRL
jgi:ATP-binding cassette, subfamily B, heavy metal transporter